MREQNASRSYRRGKIGRGWLTGLLCLVGKLIAGTILIEFDQDDTERLALYEPNLLSLLRASEQRVGRLILPTYLGFKCSDILIDRDVPLDRGQWKVGGVLDSKKRRQGVNCLRVLFPPKPEARRGHCEDRLLGTIW